MASWLLRPLVQVVTKINSVSKVASASRSISYATSTTGFRNPQFTPAVYNLLSNRTIDANNIKGDPIIKNGLIYKDPLHVPHTIEKFDPFAKIDADCPSSVVNKVISDGTTNKAPMALANIMVIRRRKMRKHRYKKFCKKNKVKWELKARKKKALQDKKDAVELKEIRAAANAYNPEDEVDAHLKRAHDAGWYIDILQESKQKNQKQEV